MAVVFAGRASARTSIESRDMSGRIRWGVLGTAKIAVEKVIPAMQTRSVCEVAAIASRDPARAQAAARRLGIRHAYGSYDALLADADIDAVYIPLPNHLHVPLTISAAEHGRHVLCEKPIALSSADVRRLIQVRDRTGVHIEEAFMVRTHPQWLRVLELCQSGRIGDVRAYRGSFSYFNEDAQNIRNIRAFGGGALMDIGCYFVTTSSMVMGGRPHRVACSIVRDGATGVDTLTSMILEYTNGHAVGTCGIRMVPHQRVEVFGSRGRLEVEIPFNAPTDRPCRVFVDSVGSVFETGVETVTLPVCDQYAIQGELFSRAILDRTEVAWPLEQSLENMRVIEALFRSADTGAFEAP